MRPAALLGIALCLIASWGCGGKTTNVTGPDREKATMSGTGGNGEYTATGPDGQKITGTQKGDKVEYTVDGTDGKKVAWSGGAAGVDLPEGFPKDVPLYPGATNTVSVKEGKSTSVVLKSNDESKKVRDFYASKLKENGWTIETAADIEQGSMFSAKKDKRRLSVVMSGGNISIGLQDE